MVDLDQAGHSIVQVFDESDFRPHAVRMSRMLLDRDLHHFRGKAENPRPRGGDAIAEEHRLGGGGERRGFLLGPGA